MSNYKWENVMIDLETLATRPDAAVISIGAVGFDVLNGIQKTEDAFYREISVASNKMHNRSISSATIQWWHKQRDHSILNRVFEPDAPNVYSLTGAMEQFTEWLRTHTDTKNVKVWGNGSDFDNVIINDVCASLSMSLPWGYANNRCYRTLRNLPVLSACSLRDTANISHHALEDAYDQAQDAIHLLNLLHTKVYELTGLTS